ncbi:amino acid ABC transporter permease [Shinella zoogloeoides]|uniref:amino acid ABC transporter permease n=1 Tax=Shinella zoogloeoides TaxID=352475 RepID=UPI0028B23022|nr:amino acid ABC transporter permease [Shinella zoogloeoides]
MIREFSTVEMIYILSAARWTITLSLIAFIGGGILGLFVALARVSPSRTVRMITAGYIQVFQCIPLLMLLFLIFFGLAMTGYSRNQYFAVSVALSLYAGAYLGEIWRGAIQAVPRGQWEGSLALGFSYFEQFRYVIFPQSVRIAIPPTVGFLVQIIKNTSLASIIGFTELTQAAQFVNNLTYAPFKVYPFAGAIYFSMCFPLYLLSRFLERRLDVHSPSSIHH